MLAVFFGNDTIKVRQRAYDFAESKKDEATEVVGLSADNYEAGRLRAVSAGASLFGDRSLYIIDTPKDDAVLKEELPDVLEELSRSDNIFVVIEGPLLAAEKKTYERAADLIEEHKKAAAERFNNFALADALLKKDKKLLWLLLNEARLEGIAEEEIIGVLWWQLKTMRLASITKSAAEAGLKDFPYNKAKRGLAKFAPGELETLSRKLLELLHESRQGRGELDISLERFALEI